MNCLPPGLILVHGDHALALSSRRDPRSSVTDYLLHCPGCGSGHAFVVSDRDVRIDEQPAFRLKLAFAVFRRKFLPSCADAAKMAHVRDVMSS